MPDYAVTTLETSGATSVAFSPDESRIYVARSNGTMDVFDTSTHAKIATWTIGTNLGGISISEDGSFLLAVERSLNPVPPYPPPQSSVLYRINTSNGSFTTYTQPGSAYLDVEIVDNDTAIVTGGQSLAQRLDLTTGTFTSIANSVYYGNSQVMVENEHLTLLAELGISNGPLALYDDRTDTIIARGDNYQTMGAGSGSIGSNFGHQAISEAAGLVAQFAQDRINFYDLSLHYLRDLIPTVPGGGGFPMPFRPDGLAFDPTGAFLFVRFTDIATNSLVKYNVQTGAQVGTFALDSTPWHNNAGAADQITLSANGKLILVHDNSGGKLQLIDLTVGDELIQGTADADALAGGKGDDTYVVNHAGDIVNELLNEGDDTIQASVTFTLPDNVERLELTGAAVDGTGNQLDNQITGNGLANFLSAGGGADTIHGGDGDDTIVAGTGNDTLHGEGGNDTLWGEAGDDVIYGGPGNDTVNGGEGNDTAYVTGGTTSADTSTEVVDLGINVPGGNEYGVDHLVIDYSAITENVVFHGPHQLDVGPEFGYSGAEARADIGGVQRLSFAGVGLLTVTTGSGNDRVYGVSPTDVISTGAGDDVIYPLYTGLFINQYARIDGGAGTDVVYGVNWHDLDTAVVLDLNNSVGVTIGSGATERYLRNIEQLYGFTSGQGDDVITLRAGGALLNMIYTEGGDDTVTVFGGTTHLDTGYTQLDLGSGANDHVIASFGSAAEQVSYVANGDTGNISIGGVQLHNYSYFERLTLTSGSGNDVLDGRQGALTQVLSAGAGADVLYGGTGNDTLNGGSDDDTLGGGFGSDMLDGGAGNDAMAGGAGDDFFIVDSAGDTIVEGFGGGLDTVFTSVGYTLADDVERLGVNGFTTTYAIDLTGNAQANEMWGNDGANVIDGRNGADTMTGFGGNDFYIVDNTGDVIVEGFGAGLDTVFTSVGYMLSDDIERLGVNGFTTTYAIDLTGNVRANEMWGNDGANVIDGRTGADIMTGFGGDDFYIVDNAGDVIIEGFGGGLDTVFTSISYTLSDDIERLGVNGFTTTYAINLTGNAHANEMWGNDGANVIDGRTGADIMTGFGGNDFYVVDNAGDMIVEGSGGGFDTVFTSIGYTLSDDIERLGVNGAGTTYAVDLIGNARANEISGNDGANMIAGQGGSDTLIGYGGADTFAFTSSIYAGSIDRILDFQVGVDKIGLDDGEFAGLSFGTLAAGAFYAGTAAHDIDDRIIYDSASGALYFDADGSGAGAAVQFAALSNGLLLTAGDFQVI